MLTIPKEQFNNLNIEHGLYLLDKNTNLFYHIIGLEFKIDTVVILHYKVDFNHSYIPVNQDNDYAIYKTTLQEIELSSPADKRGILSKTLEDLEDEYMFVDFEDSKKSKSLVVKTSERERYEFDKFCIVNKISQAKFFQICLQNRDKILNQYKGCKLRELDDNGKYKQDSLF